MSNDLKVTVLAIAPIALTVAKLVESTAESKEFSQGGLGPHPWINRNQAQFLKILVEAS